jgi:hypothetical protein
MIEKEIRKIKGKQNINLRYCMIGAYENGAKEHPEIEMKKLGIEYESTESFTISECWIFFNCINLPIELPEFLDIIEFKGSHNEWKRR